MVWRESGTGMVICESHLVDLLRTPEQRAKETQPIVEVAFPGSWGKEQKGCEFSLLGQ